LSQPTVYGREVYSTIRAIVISMTNMGKIQEHPAALLFPLIGNGEYAALRDDIAENGLRDPVVLYEGDVLDGRNRLRACEDAKVEPRFTTYEGDDPFAYVISCNIHRRNLTQSQLTGIAVEAREPLMVEARERQIAGGLRGSAVAAGTAAGTPLGPIGPKGSDLGQQGHSAGLAADSGDLISGPKEPKVEGRSAELAAEMFGVGHMQVKRAVAVRKASPEMFEQIKQGGITVGAAYAQLSPPKKRKHSVRFYGKGDKWKEAVLPLRRYLGAAEKRGYQFTLVNPKEAAARVVTIDNLVAALLEARADLEPRSQSASLTASGR
jgi:hypothetical protein